MDAKHPIRLILTITAETEQDVFRQLKTLAEEWASKPPGEHFKGTGRKCE